jgi:hypothetical protein
MVVSNNCCRFNKPLHCPAPEPDKGGLGHSQYPLLSFDRLARGARNSVLEQTHT